MIGHRKAQTAVWGLLGLLALVAFAAGLIDVYRLMAARNWGYAVAQEAALAGASLGRDWAAISAGGQIRLVDSLARQAAEQLAQEALATRGIVDYILEVRVLSEPEGGSVPGFPPRPVRLGEDRGAWSSSEPAVGVYLSFPVRWLLLDRIGVVEKSVSAFAAAGVGE